MIIQQRELENFTKYQIGDARTLRAEKEKINQFIALNKHHPQSHLLAAMYYQQQYEQIEPNQRIYLTLAEASFKKALSLSKDFPSNNSYDNQINYQLGLLYNSFSQGVSVVEAAKYQYLAVQHFQAVKTTLVPAGCQDELERELPLASLQYIAGLYSAANDNQLVESLAFKGKKLLVKNHINALVAHIEFYRSGGVSPATDAVLTPFVDINALREGNLVFLPGKLSLEQVYKIARLCKDKQLISERSYLDTLWHIESQVEYSQTLEGEHLRKKTRYQLLVTLTALYQQGLVNLDGFNVLYEKLMSKINNFRLALLVGDNKAENVKRFMDQVVDKGVAPVLRRERANYFVREYTPIVSPIDHFVSTFNIVTSITRPLGKWPLYIIGTILDIVLIVPLIWKIFSSLEAMELKWSNSWFTGLLGKIVGEGIIGFGFGAIASLALTAIIYPVRLVCSLIRRAAEAISRWSDESNQRNATERAINQQRPLESQQLNQAGLTQALESGITLKQKPPGNFQQDKKFTNYPTGSSYLRVYQFLEPDSVAPSAPPMQFAPDVQVHQPQPAQPLIYQPQQMPDENPYLLPPAYSR